MNKRIIKRAIGILILLSMFPILHGVLTTTGGHNDFPSGLMLGYFYEMIVLLIIGLVIGFIALMAWLLE